MSSKLFTLDSRQLEASIADLLETPSKRTTREQIETQMKGVTRTAADTGPPGGQGVRGVAAKRRGEGTITRDLLNVFTPVRSPLRVTATRSEMPAIHENHKIVARSGRGTRVAEPEIFVLSRDLTNYRKEVEKRVGALAGGVQPAARALGISLAKWLSRHSSSGGYVFKITAAGVTAIVINEEVYSGMSSHMDRVMQWSLDVQAKKIDRMLNDLWQKQAAKSGFRIRN